MRIIQSPNEIKSLNNIPALFLAGGISNCPDWQKQLCDSLSNYAGNGYIINPRRVGDLDRTGKDAETQIRWEIKYIDRSSFYVFWFPEESVCPITLFELGKITTQISYEHFDDIYICVGIHPNYSRKMDLEIQLPTILKDIKIVYSLEDIEKWIIQTLNLKEIKNERKN